MTDLQRGRPRTKELRLEREVRVYDLLDGLGVEFWRTDHDAVFTMEDCEAVSRVLGVEMCKNLMLCNRQRTAFYLLMLPEDKVFKTKVLSAKIGSSRLSFAGGEDMLELLDTEPGALSVLGLMNDTEGKVRLLVDEDLLKNQWLGVHPCVNTSAIKFLTADLFEKILPHLGREALIVNLNEAETEI